MTEPMTREWLEEAVFETRALTLGTYENATTCILTTKIALAVLERHGVPARPLAVRAQALNHAAAHAQATDAAWPMDAWTVIVDPDNPAGTRPGGWNAHLVLMIRSSPALDLHSPRLLLDLTADQFDRPAKRIRIAGPVGIGIPAGEPFTPHDPVETVVGQDEDMPTVLRYWPLAPGVAEASNWRTLSDWVDTTEHAQQAADAIIERLG